MILDLHRQGLGVSAIARRTGLNRKTVRKYIESGLEPPEAVEKLRCEPGLVIARQPKAALVQVHGRVPSCLTSSTVFRSAG